MADLTQTAANVGVQEKTVSLQIVTVGEGVTQGQPLYKKAADNKYWRADADTQAEADCKGIALTQGATDEFVVMAKSGKVDVGSTLVVGETYVVSTNSGAIAPIGDLTTGDYVTHLGVASAADELDINIQVSGTVKP